MTSFDPITVAILMSIFITILSALMLFYKAQREGHYNQKLQRAEIHMLRESFERQIYEITDKLASTEDRWADLNHLLISRLHTQRDVAPTDAKVSVSEFLKAYGITDVDLKINPELVFVLTPFNKQFYEPFQAISDACRQLGLLCIRGDEDRITGDIMPHILRKIVQARVIIANIDGRNPNVFYELGIAHALGKVTILVTSSIDSTPLDLRSRKLIVYDRVDQLTRKLELELARTIKLQSDLT